MKTAREIADFVGGTLHGNPAEEIHTVGSLERGETGSLAYAETMHLDDVRASAASCFLIPSEDFPGRTVIVVENPRLAFAKVARWLFPYEPPFQGVDPTALIRDGARLASGVAVGAWVIVERGAQVGRGTTIFPGCYIGADCRIGSDCIIYPHAVLYPGVEIGERVIIHAGTVLGSDGFGFVLDDSRYFKIPQMGHVQIDSDVEVGANSCVDRGALDDTIIGEGAKIDNLCQVGHNVQIGSHAIISSQSGIAGSSYVGHHATVGGQVGVADHCHIGDRAVLGAHTGIPSRKRVPDGQVYWGSPGRPLKQGKLLQAYFSRLPKMSSEIKLLRAEVNELKQKLSKS